MTLSGQEGRRVQRPDVPGRAHGAHEAGAIEDESVESLLPTLPREAIYALSQAPPGSEATKVLTYVRNLGGDEQAFFFHAESAFWRLSATSPFMDLQRAYTELQSSLSAAPPNSAEDAYGHAANTSRLFRAWLNEFYSFAERTKAWISLVFGKEHPAYSAFERLLSAEYDSNAGYRIATGLRNLSTHAIDVLNVQAFHVSTVDDQSLTHVELAIDGPSLVSVTKRVKASIREELASATDPIDIELLSRMAQGSCRYAYGRLIEALWDELEPARELISGIHEEALSAGGEVALILNIDTSDLASGRLNHRYNPMHLVEQLDGLRESTGPSPASDLGAPILLEMLTRPQYESS